MYSKCVLFILVCFRVVRSHDSLFFNVERHDIFFLTRIHSWGDSLEEAFEQCAMGMFGYMTDTETVEPIDTVEVESEGESCSYNSPLPIVLIIML